MITIPIKKVEGQVELFDKEGDFVGKVNTKTGKAIIGDAFWDKERTCLYEPEITATVYDKDDSEIDTDEPADNCEAFACSECGGMMMYGDSGWFETEPPYSPRFDFCPYCGARVIGC